MRRRARKDVEELLHRLEAQGWRLEDRQDAVLAYSPDRKTIVTIHRTPSAHN